MKLQSIILLLIHVVFTDAGKILISPSTLFPSHRWIMRDLAGELVKRGHQVVWWEIGVSHRKDIPLPAGVEERTWTVNINEGYINNLFKYHNASVFDHLFSPRVSDVALKAANWMVSLRMCETILQTRKADFDALVAEHFDTAVIDDLYNPCGLAHVALQKSVYVYWSMTSMRTEIAWSNQSPSPPSYVPVPGTGYNDVLDFWQRSYNLMSYIKQIYIHHRIVQRRIDNVLRQYYPQMIDSFSIERNASLNFINTPPIFDFPRAFMPRVNFVGALHCRKAKNLEDTALSTFVSKHKNVIVFTTGFTVQWKRISAEVTSLFSQSFGHRPDVGFVWQYDGPAIANLPPNVFIAKWLPQQDLLGHENVKALMTHGGINSVVEAMYHGKPVIGIPLLTENYDNLKRATARGAGFILEKQFLSVPTLTRSYDKILQTESYSEKALEFQDFIIDVPYTELNHSAFWVEFIIRHKEIPHARSGADDLNVIQYFLIDVVAFLFAILFLSIMTMYYVIKFTCRLCCSSCLSSKSTPAKADAAKKNN